MFQLHQKWSLFAQLAAEKRTPFLVQLKQIFGPSYFDSALGAEHLFITKGTEFFQLHTEKRGSMVRFKAYKSNLVKQ